MIMAKKMDERTSQQQEETKMIELDNEVIRALVWYVDRRRVSRSALVRTFLVST